MTRAIQVVRKGNDGKRNQLEDKRSVCFVAEDKEAFACAFIHLLNYDYRKETDRVEPVDELKITLRELPGETVRVYRLDGQTQEYSAEKGDSFAITLKNVPVYTVIAVTAE